jgi:hypothetical protein
MSNNLQSGTGIKIQNILYMRGHFNRNSHITFNDDTEVEINLNVNVSVHVNDNIVLVTETLTY